VLAEYQDSIEVFLRLGVKPKGSVKWVLEKDFVLKVMSERAYEEPCLSLLRSFAFVPFFWKLFASRSRVGWWRVGEDLYYSSFRDALLTKDFIKHMGVGANTMIFSAALGGFLGSSILSSPVPGKLLKEVNEFLKEGGCELSYEGEAVVRVGGEEVLSFSFPLSVTISSTASLFGHPFLALANEVSKFPEDPLKLLEGALEYFKALEMFLKREKGTFVEEGCWYEVGREVRGKCGFEFELEDPLPEWALESLDLKALERS